MQQGIDINQPICMKQAILAIVMAGLSLSLQAQGFFVELGDENLSTLFGNESDVTLNDGSTVKGKLISGSLVNGYLKSITVKDDTGEKHKFKAADMTTLRVKASRLVQFAMMSESSSSIKEMTKANFEEIVNREYVIFERASKVKKDDKFAMMQLLNPGSTARSRCTPIRTRGRPTV
jgi:hypothetical protein